MSRMHSDGAFVAFNTPDGLQRIASPGVEGDLESFVYLMSAELRRSTRALSTVPQSLDSDVKDPADLSETMALLAGHTEHIDTMLENLMRFARVGRLQDVTQVDLNDLVYKVAAALDLPDRVTLRCLGVLPKFCMGARDAAQVLRCLLENAVVHSDNAPVTVTFGASVTDRQLELRVTDTGPGIPAGHIQRLFRPLAHLPYNRGQPRSGMGLAIVHRVVTEYRGEVWAGPGPNGVGLDLRLRLREAPHPVVDELLAPLTHVAT